MEHNRGRLESLRFIADGEIPDDSGKVIIQVGTSDPRIDSIIVTLTIEPSPLSVTINPPNISAGDTAEIILTYKYSDGTTEVLTPGQYTYQLSIIEGCSLGQLLVNGMQDQFFYDVDLPMYFVADSLASGIATIKVGIIEGGGSAGKIKANNSLQSLPNAIQSCSGFDFEAHKKDVGEVIIGGVCQALKKCTENNAGKKPLIEVFDLPNGYNNTFDYCNVNLGEEFEKGGALLGYFIPVWSKEQPIHLWRNYNKEKLFMDYQIELCHDEYSNVIQFGIANDNLILKTIVGYCENGIHSGQIVIDNIDELRTKIPRNINSIGRAIDDIEKQRTYGVGGIYVLKELTWVHELKHKDNFKNQIVNPVNNNYDYLNYSRFDVSCEGQNSIDDVKEEMKDNFNKKLDEFEAKLLHRYEILWGAKESTEKTYRDLDYLNETIYTHNTYEVQKVIDDYITELMIILSEIALQSN